MTFFARREDLQCVVREFLDRSRVVKESKDYESNHNQQGGFRLEEQNTPAIQEPIRKKERYPVGEKEDLHTAFPG